MANLRNLEHLLLDNNSFSELPEVVCRLESLQVLLIEKNNLENLPECIGNLRQMNHLSGHENQLTHLPEAWCQKKDLVIKIDGNPLTEDKFRSQCRQAMHKEQ